MCSYKVVSLFSGAGGLDYGFANEGFEIVFANDFNRFACETYRHNFSRIFGHNCSYLKEGDINGLFDSIPEGADILVGGAPCQSWSMMGNRKGADDDRGKLLYKQVEVLADKRPRMFVWENVKGLLSHNNGDSFKLLLKLIEEAGYEAQHRIFNMSEYEVPQRRERVLIFGKLVGEDIDLSGCIPAKAPRRALHLQELLMTADHKLLSHTNHNRGPQGKAREVYGAILRPGENLAFLTDEDIAVRFAARGITSPPARLRGHRPIYRLRPNETPPTMVFNGGANVPWHPWEDRSLSVREAAIIQTFPFAFEFKGGLKEQYKQVANAVPPLFSSLLAQAIHKQL